MKRRLSVNGVSRDDAAQTITFGVFTPDRESPDAAYWDDTLVELSLNDVRFLAHLLPENDPACQEKAS